MTVKLGYDTNGFAHHRLEDALAVLSELGYETVAITLDHSALNPFDRQVGREAEKVQRLLVKHHLGCVLETSARYLLDPWRKFQPTLISPRPRERERRIEFLRRAIKLAATLHADIVSFQSGDSLDDAPHSLSPRISNYSIGCDIRVFS
jgi:sugar phosphate isomerase/epimerase